MRYVLVVLLTFVVQAAGVAQAPQAPADFDVVSIKKNSGATMSGGIRSLPDGSMVMTNQPIHSILSGASAERTRDIVGMPDWAMTERYDVTVKPPQGTTTQQRALMLQRMFADRFKAVVHVEPRERDGFWLVVARSDGRLGPAIKPSSLDCGPRPPGSPPPEPPAGQFDPAQAGTRCGGLFSNGSIVSGGMRLSSLVLSLESLAGGPIEDHTGLTAFYAFELRYSVPRPADAASVAADPSDAPNIFTALQEQLGLKLQPQKTTIPVLVIDHLERPSEN